MTISKRQDGSSLTIRLEGRLDTVTSPELEKALQDSLDGVTELTLDFEKLDYISSAGLRVLLLARKKLSQQGTVKLVCVNETIMEILEVTGFTNILSIE